jgi:hypothetical protein
LFEVSAPIQSEEKPGSGRFCNFLLSEPKTFEINAVGAQSEDRLPRPQQRGTDTTRVLNVFIFCSESLIWGMLLRRAKNSGAPLDKCVLLKENIFASQSEVPLPLVHTKCKFTQKQYFKLWSVSMQKWLVELTDS